MYQPPIVVWVCGVLQLRLPFSDSIGTLILHEVAALSPEEQQMLRDWLDSRRRRTQVITTSTVALFPLVTRGAFFEDLYYRLNVAYARVLPSDCDPLMAFPCEAAIPVPDSISLLQFSVENAAVSHTEPLPTPVRPTPRMRRPSRGEVLRGVRERVFAGVQRRHEIWSRIRRQLAAETRRTADTPRALVGVVAGALSSHRSSLLFGCGVTVGALFVLMLPVEPRSFSTTPREGLTSVPVVTPTRAVVRVAATSVTDEPQAARPVALSSGRRGTSSPSTVVKYRGSLAVDSAPKGARVYVNGIPVGATPVVLRNVPSGSRVVRLELDGYRHWSTAVQVVANQRVVTTAQLSPSYTP
jgi:hypothetical protein